MGRDGSGPGGIRLTSGIRRTVALCRNPARRWLGAWHGVLAPRFSFLFFLFVCKSIRIKCLAIETKC